MTQQSKPVPETVEVKKEALTLERIALAAVVALLSWNVYTTNQLSIAQAVQSAQLEAIKAELSARNGRYVNQGDFLVLQAELQAQERRFENWLARLGDRLNDAERIIDKELHDEE